MRYLTLQLLLSAGQFSQIVSPPILCLPPPHCYSSGRLCPSYPTVQPAMVAQNSGPSVSSVDLGGPPLLVLCRPLPHAAPPATGLLPLPSGQFAQIVSTADTLPLAPHWYSSIRLCPIYNTLQLISNSWRPYTN